MHRGPVARARCGGERPRRAPQAEHEAPGSQARHAERPPPHVRFAAAPRRRSAPPRPCPRGATFASWLISAGVSHRLVAALLGHSSTALVDRVYARIFGTTAHHRAVSKIARPIEPAIVTPPPTPAAPVAPPAFANVKPETLAKVKALLTLVDGDAADLLRGLVENAAPRSARSLPDRGRKTARGGAGGTRAKVLNTRNPGN